MWRYEPAMSLCTLWQMWAAVCLLSERRWGISRPSTKPPALPLGSYLSVVYTIGTLGDKVTSRVMFFCSVSCRRYSKRKRARSYQSSYSQRTAYHQRVSGDRKGACFCLLWRPAVVKILLRFSFFFFFKLHAKIKLTERGLWSRI